MMMMAASPRSRNRMIVKEREIEEEEEEGVEQGERSRGPAIHRGSDACPRIAAIHSLP